MKGAMRRAYRFASWVLVLVGLAACAGTAGIPRNPFQDITVPDTFLPYSDRWLFIRSSTVTAANLVYMTQLDMDGALAAVRAALARDGWTAHAPRHSRSPDGFRMMSLDFVKGPDTCRVTLIEGANATRVELAVARLTAR